MILTEFKKVRKAVVELILNNPRARERKNRNKAVGSIIIKKYNLLISQDVMADIVRDIESGTRAWRDFLLNYPEYRGSDYDDKIKYDQEHKLVLGYIPGLEEQKKILERL